MSENFQLPSDDLTQAIVEAFRRDESEMVAEILKMAHLDDNTNADIQARAQALVHQVRRTRLNQGGIDAFMAQYDLSSEEGIALMCMAEALLRVPDTETIDKLIRDKVTTANWSEHAGKSESLFVNAATWALMLTGKVLADDNKRDKNLGGALKRFVSRTSEPVIRQSVAQAMRILGKQFVMGRSIQEALRRAKDLEKKGYTYSYDMLGEAARTEADAIRYFESYQQAIVAIAEASRGKSVYAGPGISVKLSALYARYEVSHYEGTCKHLLPRLCTLVEQARDANIGFTIDAEESERLFISLDLLERVLRHVDFKGWQGFGLAVQAYQKRAPYVIDWLVSKAREYGVQLMVRLVKGAYWDTEIKNAQVEGMSNYPVYTRKLATDVSYIACAKKLLAATDCIYPQFATHNAHSLSAIWTLAGDKPFEFQCLHGMGDALYDPIVGEGPEKRPCRIYAPVGTHEDLLAYLVRRLLENGANSSFVNRIIDEKLPVEELVACPMQALQQIPEKTHPRIPLPRALYGQARVNSKGIDLDDPTQTQPLMAEIKDALQSAYHAHVTGQTVPKATTSLAIISPHDNQTQVGHVHMATPEMAETAISTAHAAFDHWSNVPVQDRANCLLKYADALEAHYPKLMAILIREAGKTLPDAVAEVREAIDFCRYYAAEIQQIAALPEQLEGPTGEDNSLRYAGRGVIVCISPWNFPLAIFTGQIVAALAAGNTVVAKPAEQTPLVAFEAVKLMHAAGIPEDVVQLLPGVGETIGPVLTSHPHTAGVMFTGSTAVAKILNQSLAQREGAIVPLIAETGGQNAMIVDSSALPEQVIFDVVQSAFYSAGQRCSACRVLYIQEDVAPKMLAMLKGAMAMLTVSDPMSLSTDVGPVIDDEAQQQLMQHIEKMKADHDVIFQCDAPAHGTYCAPIAFKIPDIKALDKEVFGPILHVITFANDALDNVIDDINSTGYGLTLGVHSRINETINHIISRAHAGNIYVNRNMTGAVVGVQPFGGEGLSGTGPKAGGPNYLKRLMLERTVSVNTAAAGGNASLMSLQM